MEQRRGHSQNTVEEVGSSPKKHGEEHLEHQPQRQDHKCDHQGRTEDKDVVQATVHFICKCAAHVARMKGSKWTKVATEWTPRGRGRPKRRRRLEIEEKVGTVYMRRAKNRAEATLQQWRERLMMMNIVFNVTFPSIVPNISSVLSGAMTSVFGQVRLNQ